MQHQPRNTRRICASKNRLIGGAVNLDANAYHFKWKNIQQVLRLPDCGLSYVANLGSASGTGAEISVAVRPTAGVSFGGNVGYTKVTIDDDLFGGSGLLLRREGQRIGGPLWSAPSTARLGVSSAIRSMTTFR